MGAARRYDSPVSDQSPTPAPDDVPFRYTAALAQEIELRWQDEWEKRGTYFTPNPVGELTDGEGRHADPAARSAASSASPAGALGVLGVPAVPAAGTSLSDIRRS